MLRNMRARNPGLRSLGYLMLCILVLRPVFGQVTDHEPFGFGIYRGIRPLIHKEIDHLIALDLALKHKLRSVTGRDLLGDDLTDYLCKKLGHDSNPISVEVYILLCV